MGELPLHVVSETATSITLGWTPQPGLGYVFSVDGQIVSRTNDPTRSSTKFTKNAKTYEVAVLAKGDVGTHPPPRIPDEPPPPVSGKVPALTDVGAAGTLSSRAGGTITGTFTNVRFTSEVNFANSSGVTCTNCEFAAGIGTTYPNHGPVTLTKCTIRGGWWFEDQNGVGGHDKVTLDHCLLDGGVMQAMRPKGSGTIRATDSWFMSAGTPPTGAHTEAVQVMWGGVFVAERCAFSRQPVTNNTVTAVYTFEAATDGNGSSFTDCEVGYWNGSAWTRGGGYYQVYPARSSWIRPVIHSDPGSAWYTQPPVLVDPVYRP